MAERLLTPSKITAWLDCAHFLTLRHEVDNGTRDAPPILFGEMAQMLVDKGKAHENALLAQYRADSRDVYEVPDWKRGNESPATQRRHRRAVRRRASLGAHPVGRAGRRNRPVVRPASYWSLAWRKAIVI